MMSPIFIVGVPRSGTTLLQSLLSASPETYSLPETHFFSTVLPKLNCQFGDTLSPEKLKEAFALIHELMELRFSDDVAMRLEAQARQGMLTGKFLFEAILEAYRPQTDVARWLRVIEKTPLHLEYIPEILAHYPTAKFIHIVRDPRSVISSIIQTSFAPTQWLLWYTQYWNFAVELGRHAVSQFPDAVIAVRYEDLTENPKLILQKLCEFIGMQFDLKMLAHFADNSANFILSKENWKLRNQDGEIYSEKTPWINRLTTGEAWLIERLCQKKMLYYRYYAQIQISFRAKITVFWHNIHYLRSAPQAENTSLYLIKRCNEAGLSSSGRLLAVILLYNNCRLFNVASVRKTFAI